MKKNTNEKIIIIIIIIGVCAALGLFVYKNYIEPKDKKIIVDNEEINLGALGGAGNQVIVNDGGGGVGGEVNNDSTTPQTVTCSAGQYLPSNSTSCSYCRSGYYCTYSGTYEVKNKDQGITGNCQTGQTSNSGAKYSTDCYDKALGSLSVSKNSYYVPSETASGLTFASATAGSGYIVRNWSVSSSLFKISFANYAGQSVGQVVFNGSVPKGSGSSCATSSVTITASNNTNSVSTTQSLCVYCSDWQTANGYWLKAGRNYYGSHFSTSGCNFFSNPDGDYYTKWHGRCCGVNAPPEDGACYGDEPYIGIATKVKFIAGPPKSAPGGYKYRYDNITSEANCKLMDSAKACTDGNKSTPSQEKDAEKCEDTVEFEVAKTSTICSSDSSKFYTIGCSTKVSADFDMDDNLVNSGNKLYKGQGFKYNIDILEKITCNAEFNSEEWINAYEKIMAKMKTVKSKRSSTFTTTAYDAYQKNDYKKYEDYIKDLKKVDGDLFTDDTEKYIYELYNLARDIENIVISYNNYAVDTSSDEKANLLMEYKINGESNETTYTYNFKSEKNDCNPVKKVSKTHNNVKEKAKWLEAPKNYTFTYEKLINLYPEEVLINKSDGKVTESQRNIIEGGNKIYIDYGADKQTIPLSITVGGLAGNDSTITNKKCSVTVEEQSLLYRPIDINNPFINSEWKKGENWLNTTYDFTKTIHSDVWNKGSLYIIDLTKDKISELKESNQKNANAYLGLCDSQDDTLKDSITKWLCNLLK